MSGAKVTAAIAVGSFLIGGAACVAGYRAYLAATSGGQLADGQPWHHHEYRIEASQKPTIDDVVTTLAKIPDAYSGAVAWIGVGADHSLLIEVNSADSDAVAIQGSLRDAWNVDITEVQLSPEQARVGPASATTGAPRSPQ